MQKSAAQPPVIPAPIINLTLGDRFLGTAGAEPAVRAAAAASAAPLPVSNMLLDPSRTIGPEMKIPDFCAAYDLPPQVLKHLEDNSYGSVTHLCFVSLADLDDMGFKGGEKAALRDAVERWSVLRV
jgi:hypothetical protein